MYTECVLSRRCAARRRQRGLSLIELIIFMVIVSVAVIGVLQVLNVTVRNSADPLRRKQALLLAEGLMEEVQLAPFTFCDPADAQADTATSAVVSSTGCATTVETVGAEAIANRPYNNVNHYVSQYSTEESTKIASNGKLLDAGSNIIAGGATLSGYSATIKITPTDTLNDINSTATPLTTNVLRITVKVIYGTGPNENLVLDGYRTRYAPTVSSQ